MGLISIITRIRAKIESILSLGKNKGSKTSFFTTDFSEYAQYEIGQYTYGRPVVLYPNGEATLRIGKFCSIAKDVTIFLGGNHRTDWISTYPFDDIPEFHRDDVKTNGHPSTKGDVVIGNDVWLGRNCVIFSGISISHGAVVGAFSSVTRNIGPYEVWAGNPAKFIRKRFSDDEIQRLLQIEWWNWDIEKILEHKNILCSEISNIQKLYDGIDEAFLHRT